MLIDDSPLSRDDCLYQDDELIRTGTAWDNIVVWKWLHIQRQLLLHWLFCEKKHCSCSPQSEIKTWHSCRQSRRIEGSTSCALDNCNLWLAVDRWPDIIAMMSLFPHICRFLLSFYIIFFTLSYWLLFGLFFDRKRKKIGHYWQWLLG